MPREATISRSVLSDRVKDRLLQAILAGRYPPGSRIVETRAAREFGTSQAPVREALRDLEALGVVEIHAFRGARVRRPSTNELLEAYAVRSELEALGVRLAAPLLTDADLEELQSYVDLMRQAAAEGDIHAEATADASFHGRLIEISGNRTLKRVWDQLEPFSRTYITMVVPGADRTRIAELHVPVLDALRGRDPERTAVAIHRHFADARSMLAALWTEEDQNQSSPGMPRPRRAPASRAATRRPSPSPQPSERTA